MNLGGRNPVQHRATMRGIIMANQAITISYHECDFDEIMDACEEHGLRPRRNKDGSFNYWVTMTIGNTDITWFIKWSLKDDWREYWISFKD